MTLEEAKAWMKLRGITDVKAVIGEGRPTDFAQIEARVAGWAEERRQREKIAQIPEMYGMEGVARLKILR